MTRVDFVKIAGAISSVATIRGTDDHGARDAYARAIARALAGGRFDADRFLLACGCQVDPEPNR